MPKAKQHLCSCWVGSLAVLSAWIMGGRGVCRQPVGESDGPQGWEGFLGLRCCRWPERNTAEGRRVPLSGPSFYIKKSRRLNHGISLPGEGLLWSTDYWQGIKIRPRKCLPLFLKTTLACMTWEASDGSRLTLVPSDTQLSLRLFWAQLCPRLIL